MGTRPSWHIASNVGGGGKNDKTIINNIMLRFRPIAPKPAILDSVSGGLGSDGQKILSTTKRVKRKYVRVRKGNNDNHCKRRNGSRRGNSDVGLSTPTMSLQFIPEKTGTRDFPAGRSWSNPDLTAAKLAFQENGEIGGMEAEKVPDPTPMIPPTPLVETFLTVEWVPNLCMDAPWLGKTDAEMITNLEVDTCPGFVSDGVGKVEWVNEEYKRMVMRQLGLRQSPEVRVLMVMKEKLPSTQAAFTCRARLQYTWQKEKGWKMVHCDVWSIEGGGYAWRLDINTALSLGI